MAVKPMPMCPAVHCISLLSAACSAILKKTGLCYTCIKTYVMKIVSKDTLIVGSMMWFVRWLSVHIVHKHLGRCHRSLKCVFHAPLGAPFLLFFLSIPVIKCWFSRGCSLLSISLSSPEPGLAAAVFSLQSEVFMLTSIHKVALTIASTSGPVCTNRKWEIGASM